MPLESPPAWFSLTVGIVLDAFKLFGWRSPSALEGEVRPLNFEDDACDAASDLSSSSFKRSLILSCIASFSSSRSAIVLLYSSAFWSACVCRARILFPKSSISTVSSSNDLRLLFSFFSSSTSFLKILRSFSSWILSSKFMAQ